MSDDEPMHGVWLTSLDGRTQTLTVAPPWEVEDQPSPESGVWVAAPDGNGILPLELGLDPDPDDELLWDTPPEVVAGLGFDPREFLTDAEVQQEWRDICARARMAKVRHEAGDG